MKKIIFSLLALSLAMGAQAQVGGGGIPWSFSQVLKHQPVPVSSYSLPDWELALQQEQKDMENGFSKPYLIGLFTATDVRFPNSGTFSQTDDGKIVWRTEIEVAGAPAMGLYFDRFHLPKGARLFVTNGNKRQILGHYSDAHNSDDGLFAIEAVQGDVVKIELNIDSEIDLNTIQLSIDRVLVYFRSISYLAAFGDPEDVVMADPDPYGLEGNASNCHINAQCPEGDLYPKQRKSAVQILVPIGQGVGVCSATMINNTGNTTQDCKQYFLTASHCEPSSSTLSTSGPLSQMLIRFNFERQGCQTGAPATVNTMSGAKFVARSVYTQTNPPQINADFLLLELKQKVPASWDAYLAGWNRAANIPTAESSPKKFIGFHHPAGDIKKLAASNSVMPNGHANGSAGPGTHWGIQVMTGGIEQGSSGSALFDGAGRVIGIASVAGIEDNNCKTTGKGTNTLFLKYGAYSKLSYDWEYTLDGNDDIRRLKPWLDPANSGVTTIDPVKSTCEGASTDTTVAIKIANQNLDELIGVYPNPSTTGLVSVLFHLEKTADFTVHVYNLAGALQKTFRLDQVKSNSYSLDLRTLPNGVYFVKFTTGSSSTVKKVTITQ